jgi:hypothetical protein
VPGYEFLFALELSDDAQFHRMLADLATTVLGHVGYGASAIEELTGTVRRVLADGVAAGTRRCDVRFRAHRGEFQIVIAYAGGAEWRATRPLP